MSTRKSWRERNLDVRLACSFEHVHNFQSFLICFVAGWRVQILLCDLVQRRFSLRCRTGGLARRKRTTPACGFLAVQKKGSLTSLLAHGQVDAVISQKPLHDLGPAGDCGLHQHRASRVVRPVQLDVLPGQEQVEDLVSAARKKNYNRRDSVQSKVSTSWNNIRTQYICLASRSPQEYF